MNKDCFCCMNFNTKFWVVSETVETVCFLIFQDSYTCSSKIYNNVFWEVCFLETVVTFSFKFSFTLLAFIDSPSTTVWISLVHNSNPEKKYFFGEKNWKSCLNKNSEQLWEQTDCWWGFLCTDLPSWSRLQPSRAWDCVHCLLQ